MTPDEQKKQIARDRSRKWRKENFKPREPEPTDCLYKHGNRDNGLLNVPQSELYRLKKFYKMPLEMKSWMAWDQEDVYL